jgi:hypothetical protein
MNEQVSVNQEYICPTCEGGKFAVAPDVTCPDCSDTGKCTLIVEQIVNCFFCKVPPVLGWFLNRRSIECYKCGQMSVSKQGIVDDEPKLRKSVIEFWNSLQKPIAEINKEFSERQKKIKAQISVDECIEALREYISKQWNTELTQDLAKSALELLIIKTDRLKRLDENVKNQLKELNTTYKQKFMRRETKFNAEKERLIELLEGLDK